MKTSSSTSLGPVLRRLRLAAGLSQEELAERAGLSARGVSDLERGLRASPRPETVRLLAEALALGPEARAPPSSPRRTLSWPRRRPPPARPPPPHRRRRSPPAT